MRFNNVFICALVLLAAAVRVDAQKLEQAVLAYGSTGANLTPFGAYITIGKFNQVKRILYKRIKRIHWH